MKQFPRWPHEPDGGYPIGAKSPGDDPVQFEAAVAKMAAYAKARRLSDRPILLDIADMVWPAACWCIAGIGLALALMLSPPVETVDAGAIVQRPNVYAHVPFLWLGGACLAFAIQSLPARLFPWLAEAAAWRDMNTKWFRQNLRHHWLEQGAVAFDPQRALRRRPLAPLHVLLLSGAILFGFGLWTRALGERDVHTISGDEFSTTAFWFSQTVRHSPSDLERVEVNCSYVSGRHLSSNWQAGLSYQFKNGAATDFSLHPGHGLRLGPLPDIDEKIRSAAVPVRFKQGYVRNCILEFTKDRDPDFIRAFDRVMHFAEWRKARGED